MIHLSHVYDSLCHVLGNTCRLSRTAQSYAWNATGQGAIIAQHVFRKQAQEMHDAVDMLAKHIIDLGGQPILDYSDAIVAVNPPTADDIPNLPKMVRNLQDGHAQAIHSIGAAMDIAREADEICTINAMASRTSAHRAFGRELTLLAHDCV